MSELLNPFGWSGACEWLLQVRNPIKAGRTADAVLSLLFLGFRFYWPKAPIGVETKGMRDAPSLVDSCHLWRVSYPRAPVLSY
jgi:hypothetical protein